MTPSPPSMDRRTQILQAASTLFWVDPVEELAVIGLTQLMPGVTTLDNFNTKNKGLLTGSDISVSGGSVTSNMWSVDGANNNDVGSNRTVLVYPSLEAVEEFKIHRNSYGAEFGGGGGAQGQRAARGSERQERIGQSDDMEGADRSEGADQTEAQDQGRQSPAQQIDGQRPAEAALGAIRCLGENGEERTHDQGGGQERAPMFKPPSSSTGVEGTLPRRMRTPGTPNTTNRSRSRTRSLRPQWHADRSHRPRASA